MSDRVTCPNCLVGLLSTFHAVQNVPVHSVLLMPSQQVAMNYPKGDITLGYCANCGFVSNTAFNTAVHEYSTQYEETQGFSATFRKFHERLAASLIEKYDLHRKKIVEIGCGKGEFLTLLCQMGKNRGLGFDPAFVKERNPAPKDLGVEFIQDFYSEKYSDIQADFFCCKMTLEHIHETARFIRTIRQTIGANSQAVVFFQVPDLVRVLKDLAFWDIYYEHCSYFCAGSLSRVCREAGFKILQTWTDYDDQYLMIAAEPAPEIAAASLLELESPALVRSLIDGFVLQQNKLVNDWKQRIAELGTAGKRTVVWGSGSKGVAFLTMLNLNSAIKYVVDINPYRQGKFMAGTGQQIVAPEFLREYKPDVAIAMNPVYQGEIQQRLAEMGLATSVLSV